MLQRTRFIWIGCLLGAIGLSIACGGVSPREQALESTVAALQNQISTASVTATATPVPAPEWRKQLVGLTYPPMPEGWETTGGALTFSNCVTSPCPSDEETYAVSDWRQTRPAEETPETLLLFEKQVGRDAGGGAIWNVLDVLVGSEIGGSNWLWQGCRVGNSMTTDDEIVALYGIVLDPATPAWRANHLTGRFEPISSEGLTCVDENAVD